MIYLILGIALWFVAHGFKRLAPERRAAMGEKGKGPVAIAEYLALQLDHLAIQLFHPYSNQRSMGLDEPMLN